MEQSIGGRKLLVWADFHRNTPLARLARFGSLFSMSDGTEFGLKATEVVASAQCTAADFLVTSQA
jgi:hypothetical protein